MNDFINNNDIINNVLYAEDFDESILYSKIEINKNYINKFKIDYNNLNYIYNHYICEEQVRKDNILLNKKDYDYIIKHYNDYKSNSLYFIIIISDYINNIKFIDYKV